MQWLKTKEERELHGAASGSSSLGHLNVAERATAHQDGPKWNASSTSWCRSDMPLPLPQDTQWSSAIALDSLQGPPSFCGMDGHSHVRSSSGT